MKPREKILLCAAPYLVAGYLWFGLTSPIFTEGHNQDTELSKKRKEHIDLKTQLLDYARLEKERQELENSINSLRASVPKTPDIDLMVIDLEKMCLESGLDIVSVTPPEKDSGKRRNTGGNEPSENEEDTGDEPPTVEPVNRPPDTAVNPTLKKKDEPAVESGLSKELLQVKLSGDYPAFVNFMHKFDSYQRVVNITRIEAKIPTSGGEKKVAADPKHLEIAFRMTAYYLP